MLSGTFEFGFDFDVAILMDEHFAVVVRILFDISATALVVVDSIRLASDFCSMKLTINIDFSTNSISYCVFLTLTI